MKPVTVEVDAHLLGALNDLVDEMVCVERTLSMLDKHVRMMQHRALVLRTFIDNAEQVLAAAEKETEDAAIG